MFTLYLTGNNEKDGGHHQPSKSGNHGHGTVLLSKQTVQYSFSLIVYWLKKKENSKAQ